MSTLPGQRIARRLSVGLSAALVAGLVAAGMTVPASAADVEGPSVVVVSPDDPDVMVAARFPVGWRAEAATEDPARRAVNYLWGDERCELATRESEFADPASDVDDFVVGLGPGSGFQLFERQPVTLPAGPAERVDLAADDGGAWSVYILPDGRHMHELWCRGDELPEGRWLAIAETMEVGPELSITDSGFDGDIQLPEQGVALTFPGAWTVRGSSAKLGVLYAAGDTAICTLSDYSTLAADAGWQSIDELHDQYLTNAGENVAISVEESSYLDLAAGRTGFAELSWEDGARAVRYSFALDDRWLGLFCVGDPVPYDRWLSLAESLEWLPSDPS